MKHFIPKFHPAYPYFIYIAALHQSTWWKAAATSSISCGWALSTLAKHTHGFADYTFLLVQDEATEYPS